MTPQEENVELRNRLVTIRRLIKHSRMAPDVSFRIQQLCREKIQSRTREKPAEEEAHELRDRLEQIYNIMKGSTRSPCDWAEKKTRIMTLCTGYVDEEAQQVLRHFQPLEQHIRSLRFIASEAGTMYEAERQKGSGDKLSIHLRIMLDRLDAILKAIQEIDFLVDDACQQNQPSQNIDHSAS